MSILVQSVSMQQLKHDFESFLKRFYRKLRQCCYSILVFVLLLFETKELRQH